MSVQIENLVLDKTNEEFYLASELVKYGHPLIFLTGKAGTGKTTFLKYLKETTDKNTVVLAFTGVAAINAGGQTINSFFKIPFGPFVPDDIRLRKSYLEQDIDKSTIYDYFRYTKEHLEMLKALELLVIDEVSMVRCDLLDVIDRILRVFRKKENVPFGGVQVILIGDPFQLPPIDKEWHILEPYYKSSFFFSSKVLQENKPVYIELKKIYRQNEQEFIELLNRVRINEISQKELDILNSKFNPTFKPNEDSNYITLATHNRIVESTNNLKLDELKNELKLFEATITGEYPDSLLPTERVLRLKEGAQIMFIKNDKSRDIYNGKIAKIKKIEENLITTEYEKNGNIIELVLEKQTWNNIRYNWNAESKKIEETTIGTFSQYPIKLAWAITVHKSQGLTFEKVIADLGAAFASGQVYVALSRCTSFNGLILKTKVNKNAILTDSNVLNFAKNETPNTLIVKEVNSGKADFYYKKCRDSIKEYNYTSVIDNFIKAIKFRNDIETDVFKRYFVITSSKLSSYKKKLHKTEEKVKTLFNDLLNLEEQILDKNAIIEKNNTTISLLAKDIEHLESKILEKNEEIKILKNYNDNSNKLIYNLKNSIDNQNNKINNLEQIIKEKSNEITRLENLKWYDKLLKKK